MPDESTGKKHTQYQLLVSEIGPKLPELLQELCVKRMEKTKAMEELKLNTD